jgi:DNA repair protein RadC
MMARYRARGEEILLVLPDEGSAGLVTFQANPRSAKKSRVELPLGPYESFGVRVALVRSPDYDEKKSVAITGSESVYKVVKSMSALPQESMFVLLLSARNQLVGITEAVRGSWTKAVMEPSDVFRAAIVASAPAIIIVHNHPSGNPGESVEDVTLTKTMKRAGDLLGIQLLDSVIVGASGYVSLADKGLL